MREEPGVALAVLRVLAGRLREAVADHRYFRFTADIDLFRNAVSRGKRFDENGLFV